MRPYSCIFTFILSCLAIAPFSYSDTKTENVILITYDGLRHQEVPVLCREQ